jgi:hypothetical protein
MEPKPEGVAAEVVDGGVVAGHQTWDIKIGKWHVCGHYDKSHQVLTASNINMALEPLVQSEKTWREVAGRLAGVLEKVKRRHLVVEDDPYFSCPASGECCDPNCGTRCECGADEANAQIDEALAAFRKAGGV